MTNQENEFKIISKKAIYTAFIICGVLLGTCFIVASIIALFTNKDNNLVNTTIYLIGIIIDLFYMNSIGNISVKIIMFFLLLGLIYKRISKQDFEELSIKDSGIYIIISSLIIAFIMAMITYLTSLVKAEIFFQINTTNFIYDLLMILGKSILIFIVIRIFTLKEQGLNTGIIAFRNYFFYCILSLFILSVIAQVYCFILLYKVNFHPQIGTISLIVGVFNFMSYLYIILLGGIGNFTTGISTNIDAYVINILDVLKGGYPLEILIFFAICLTVFISILYSSLKKIKEGKYFSHVIVFSLLVIVFNISIVLAANIELDMKLLSIGLHFNIISLVITSTLILIGASLVRCVIISLKKIL